MQQNKKVEKVFQAFTSNPSIKDEINHLRSYRALIYSETHQPTENHPMYVKWKKFMQLVALFFDTALTYHENEIEKLHELRKSIKSRHNNGYVEPLLIAFALLSDITAKRDYLLLTTSGAYIENDFDMRKRIIKLLRKIASKINNDLKQNIFHVIDLPNRDTMELESGFFRKIIPDKKTSRDDFIEDKLNQRNCSENTLFLIISAFIATYNLRLDVMTVARLRRYEKYAEEAEASRKKAKGLDSTPPKDVFYETPQGRRLHIRERCKDCVNKTEPALKFLSFCAHFRTMAYRRPKDLKSTTKIPIKEINQAFKAFTKYLLSRTDSLRQELLLFYPEEDQTIFKKLDDLLTGEFYGITRIEGNPYINEVNSTELEIAIDKELKIKFQKNSIKENIDLLKDTLIKIKKILNREEKSILSVDQKMTEAKKFKNPKHQGDRIQELTKKLLRAYFLISPGRDGITLFEKALVFSSNATFILLQHSLGYLFNLIFGQDEDKIAIMRYMTSPLFGNCHLPSVISRAARFDRFENLSQYFYYLKLIDISQLKKLLYHRTGSKKNFLEILLHCQMRKILKDEAKIFAFFAQCFHEVNEEYKDDSKFLKQLLWQEEITEDNILSECPLWRDTFDIPLLGQRFRPALISILTTNNLSCGIPTLIDFMRESLQFKCFTLPQWIVLFRFIHGDILVPRKYREERLIVDAKNTSLAIKSFSYFQINPNSMPWVSQYPEGSGIRAEFVTICGIISTELSKILEEQKQALPSTGSKVVPGKTKRLPLPDTKRCSQPLGAASQVITPMLNQQSQQTNKKTAVPGRQSQNSFHTFSLTKSPPHNQSIQLEKGQVSFGQEFKKMFDLILLEDEKRTKSTNDVEISHSKKIKPKDKNIKQAIVFKKLIARGTFPKSRRLHGDNKRNDQSSKERRSLCPSCSIS